MASITISVQSLLNSAQYDSYTLDDTSLVDELKDTIQTDTSVDITWFNLVFNNQVLDNESLAYYNIVDGSVLRSANIIARLPTLQDRQLAKLNLSHLERQELANTRPNYDITELPTQYVGNVVVDNPNPDGLLEGRPWIAGSPPPPPSPFTLDWYGTISQPTPIGTYSTSDGGTLLATDAFFDTEQTLSSTTFTVNVDVNMGTGDGGFWNTMWGNDNYGGPDNGYIAYWNGETNLNYGNFGNPANATTPDITTNVRRLYTFVFDDINATFYVDGVLVSTSTMGSVPTIPSNTFYIGSRHDNSGGTGPSDARGGTYYSVKVEGTALTAEQVMNYYTALRA